MSQTSPPTTLRSILDRAARETGVDLDDRLDGLASAAERELGPDPDLADRLETTARVASNRIDCDPEFDRLASALLRRRLLYRVTGTDPAPEERPAVYRQQFHDGIDRGIAADRLDPALAARFDLDRLAGALRPARDDQLGYMAVETLRQRYLLRTGPDATPFELPQTFWMRVAMGLAIEESDPTARALEFYEVLSTLEFTPSTPTLFHSGTTTPQLSSCYLTTVPDDLAGIFDAYKHHAQLSKYSGGLGNDWTPVRASGSLIESTGVESTGIVPFLRISNDVTAAINRSGKRRGAACAYLAAWHLDFPDFLDLKRATGDERRRTPDMNTAAWVPDLFMERVADDEEWTLFSPDEVPDLHEAVGEEFAEKYREYERQAAAGELRQSDTLPARELWRTMLTRLFETGHPWITFKDPCNIRSPQDHVGTVRSSNLCTEITLNTGPDEEAVCNLGSVNLATHVADGRLDRDRLADTIETAMRMLDNVVDLCYYPTDDAERSNMRHRPIGLGTMGFHDALTACGVGMATEEAIEYANRWQEFVAYHAILGSSRLAAEREPHPSYEGSKWDRGVFPQDTVDRLEAERGREVPTDREETLDWERVRAHVAEHGMRNSNTMAIAPTATVSTINGTTPSIEPRYSNLYVKSNMSGEFTVINEHLVADLREADLWTDEIREQILYHDGAIQSIAAIPESIRERHRSAFEIDPRHQLRLTAHRGTWIDQSVSHNVFFPGTDGQALDSIYRTAWRLGLKTTYYLRTLGASQIEKSTLDLSEYGRTQRRSDAEDAPSSADAGSPIGAPGGGADTDSTDGQDSTGESNASNASTDEANDSTTDDASEELARLTDPTCDACQ
ncbi:ribonucleoside-diphosphate reductase subunit alpha [Halococcoides cellulosivorans]|uniref:Ribonucleoside-diphosphate reductase n=1 Tax=Halococcoides cellulosivorans TaxID=1679096 RepID=A0A2R4X2D8_9EURY|nr:ribonucleoside-diphosphate reductase subunit alpha [Halococcoides cellulosivorans]AWB27970.1 ribonucleoside-diphosphate reductase subunit alpha [Halococcoides cellulosivorans]